MWQEVAHDIKAIKEQCDIEDEDQVQKITADRTLMKKRICLCVSHVMKQ